MVLFSIILNVEQPFTRSCNYFSGISQAFTIRGMATATRSIPAGTLATNYSKLIDQDHSTVSVNAGVCFHFNFIIALQNADAV